MKNGENSLTCRMYHWQCDELRDSSTLGGLHTRCGRCAEEQDLLSLPHIESHNRYSDKQL